MGKDSQSPTHTDYIPFVLPLSVFTIVFSSFLFLSLALASHFLFPFLSVPFHLFAFSITTTKNTHLLTLHLAFKRSLAIICQPHKRWNSICMCAKKHTFYGIFSSWGIFPSWGFLNFILSRSLQCLINAIFCCCSRCVRFFLRVGKLRLRKTHIWKQRHRFDQSM